MNLMRTMLYLSFTGEVQACADGLPCSPTDTCTASTSKGPECVSSKDEKNRVFTGQVSSFNKTQVDRYFLFKMSGGV